MISEHSKKKYDMLALIIYFCHQQVPPTHSHPKAPPLTMLQYLTL